MLSSNLENAIIHNWLCKAFIYYFDSIKLNIPNPNFHLVLRLLSKRSIMVEKEVHEGMSDSSLKEKFHKESRKILIIQ
jgi:hypothetical protein